MGYLLRTFYGGLLVFNHVQCDIHTHTSPLQDIIFNCTSVYLP